MWSAIYSARHLQAPLLVERLSPLQLLKRAVDDVKGFAVEKYGLPPDFEVATSGDMHAAEITFQPALVNYVLLEVRRSWPSPFLHVIPENYPQRSSLLPVRS